MRTLSCLLLTLMLSGCLNSPSSATPTPSPATASPLAPTWKADPILRDNLKSHVVMLAETIGPRNTETPEGYKKAAAYLEAQLSKHGYKVQKQTYDVEGQSCVNLWAEKAGSAEVLVVGAHYDTLDSGTPGADDNASGCAATLELARLLKDEKDGPTIRFAFFANEEPPYFHTSAMGSYVYAQELKKTNQKLLGMISLESIGFYSDKGGSQHFPTGVSGYPDTGNFVAFISDMSSKPFLERCLAAFKEEPTMPAEGLSAPGMMEGINWSDHWAFSKSGYPALMITDTAPFRNPHYHLDSDTPDTLDYDKLAAVTEGVRRLILRL